MFITEHGYSMVCRNTLSTVMEFVYAEDVDAFTTNTTKGLILYLYYM